MSSSKPSTSKFRMQSHGKPSSSSPAPGKRGSGQVFKLSKSAEAKRAGDARTGLKPASRNSVQVQMPASSATGKHSGPGQAPSHPQKTTKGKSPAHSKFDSDSEEHDGRASSNDSDGSDEHDSDAEQEQTSTAAADRGAGKSSKTAKRKRRAVSPETFGQTLLGLIGQPASTGPPEREEAADGQSDADEDEEGRPHKKAQRTVTPNTSGAGPMLALAPQLRRAVASSRLSAKAARVMLQARKERQERARVKDVIGGWGAPGLAPGMTPDLEKQKGLAEAWLRDGGAAGRERKLRKVAQRGGEFTLRVVPDANAASRTKAPSRSLAAAPLPSDLRYTLIPFPIHARLAVVKLFNAIRAAQSTSVEDLSRTVQPRGVAPSPSPSVSEAQERTSLAKRYKTRDQEQWLSKGQQVAQLSKSNFLDLIRAGKTSKV